MKPSVYLAGPVGGCSVEEANSWRDYVAEKLEDHGIVGISPLRCEPSIDGEYKADGYHADKKFGTIQAIGAKNEFDVRNCNMILAYFPSTSFGTMVEVGMGKALHTPVVVVTDLPQVAKHPVIQYCASWSLDNLDDGLDVVIGVLGDYA